MDPAVPESPESPSSFAKPALSYSRAMASPAAALVSTFSEYSRAASEAKDASTKPVLRLYVGSVLTSRDHPLSAATIAPDGPAPGRSTSAIGSMIEHLRQHAWGCTGWYAALYMGQRDGSLVTPDIKPARHQAGLASRREDMEKAFRRLVHW